MPSGPEARQVAAHIVRCGLTVKTIAASSGGAAPKRQGEAPAPSIPRKRAGPPDLALFAGARSSTTLRSWLLPAGPSGPHATNAAIPFYCCAFYTSVEHYWEKSDRQ